MATYGFGYCNGFAMQLQTPTSEWARVMVLAQALRSKAAAHISTLDNGDYSLGNRFNSNERIADRVFSNWVVGLAHLEDFVMAAFIDAARADHWYTYEKEW